MSIFDTLKYPIGDDVTPEEFNILPEHIRTEYYIQRDILFREIQTESGHKVTSKHVPQFVALLRRIIAEAE